MASFSGTPYTSIAKNQSLAFTLLSQGKARKISTSLESYRKAEDNTLDK